MDTVLFYGFTVAESVNSCYARAFFL